jgi:hypothetical protein
MTPSAGDGEILAGRPVLQAGKDKVMRSTHQHDHELVAQAIAQDWLARDRLLVHLARDHGLTVEGVSNAGLAMLIVMHDQGHGGARCFEEAEGTNPDKGLARGLRTLRERTQNLEGR